MELTASFHQSPHPSCKKQPYANYATLPCELSSNRRLSPNKPMQTQFGTILQSTHHAKPSKGPLISMLMQRKATMQNYGETSKDHLSSWPSHHALSVKGKLWTPSPCNSCAKARNKSHVTLGQPLDKHMQTPMARQTQNHTRPFIMQARPCKVQN